MSETTAALENLDIAALRAGDRQEFTRLVEAAYTPIYRLGLRMLGDAQDAEDILQDTFLKAMRALPRFEGRSSLATWLYRIAVNESLMLLRKRRGIAISLDEGDDDEGESVEPMQIVDWCCLPESELLSDEARKILDEAIQRLPERLRVVFILRDIEGLSVKDTAQALNISEVNVKTRLLRARLKIREILSAYYGERMAEKGGAK